MIDQSKLIVCKSVILKLKKLLLKIKNKNKNKNKNKKLSSTKFWDVN
jgi:hypothetical protein